MATLAVRSPYSGETLDELQLLTAEQALERLARAKALTLAPLPAHRRIEVLRKASVTVAERKEALALLIAREGGKPLADARVEVTRAASGLSYLAGEVERLAGVEVPMGATEATTGRLAFTTMEPIGVVLAISAFNHPLNLIVHQAGPAIAAGCPVLVKPALETPLSCRALLDIFKEAGLPEGHAELVVCDNAAAEALVSDPRVAFLSFIGSAAVGWKLRRLIAAGTRIALEHGGAAPVVIDASADLEAAAKLVTKGGYYHAGQVCVSVQRVLVHERVHEAFRKLLRERVAALKVGDPTDAATEVGPLIRARDVDRVASWVDEALAGGAKLVTGGKRLEHQSYAATLLDAPAPDAKVLNEEVFGPVVSLVPVPDLDAAVREANRSRWAFQAAVFSKSLDDAMKVARGLDAAAVMINDHTAFRADWMPFGGRHESGLGTGGLGYGVRDLCAPKLVVLKLT
jgi:acyl-CoA reductase-like NAD-dependent aldehyde dehydrogenase